MLGHYFALRTIRGIPRIFALVVSRSCAIVFRDVLEQLFFVADQLLLQSLSPKRTNNLQRNAWRACLRVPANKRNYFLVIFVLLGWSDDMRSKHGEHAPPVVYIGCRIRIIDQACTLNNDTIATGLLLKRSTRNVQEYVKVLVFLVRSKMANLKISIRY